MKKTALALLFILMASPATAADANYAYSSRGFIACSCGQYINAIDTGDVLTEGGMGNAFLGYITAFNRITPDVYDILGGQHPDGATLWLENYCRENPLHHFTEAIAALIAELWPRRLTEAP